MSLISVRGLDFSVGGPLLLEDVTLDIESGERIALVGRNGAGKSTLMRLLAGELEPDDGEVRIGEAVRVARLPQAVPGEVAGTVFDQVARGLGDLGELLGEFHRLSRQAYDPEALATVQNRLDAAGGWDLDQQIQQVLDRLELDGEAAFASLSGGMKRRVLLGQALARQPDVLLLDEPTNHLDIEAIEWLEGFLRGFAGTVVFVTHDRRFLQTLATRIVEIDRGRVSSWPGDWDNYQRRVEERLHAEDLETTRFHKQLAQEEAWIRQGIKARRTRNQGRIRQLKALRSEVAARREREGRVRMDAADAGRSGRKVIEAENVDFAWDEQVMVRGFSIRIMRGDRVGVIGPNGSGKSTLLRLLLGDLPPDAGEVRLGTGLRVAYFDQHRAELRDDWSAAENVAEGRDYVEINGRRKHIIGYLRDFLFTPERARAPISRLSGGERNRLLLARLFAHPSNLLVMDEPTNDLDTETLELLEDLLADYPGTLLLVSHDRAFLDRVVTSCLVLEGAGRIGEHVGGYSDIPEKSRPARKQKTARSDRPEKPAAARPRRRTRNKLSYKLARELEQLPTRIESLEARVAEATERVNDPALYERPNDEIREVTGELEALQAELDQAYERWEALEAHREELSSDSPAR